jgi:predicted short-subunit dehydrogenase-like oxidoreductase (DUF2520 family)
MPEKLRKSFVMIGTGNLAFHLTRVLIKSGLKLKQVVGKTKNSTKKFANLFKSNYSCNINEVDSSADVYFFCVPDDQIKKLVSKLSLKNKLLIHCSGSVHMNVLKNASTDYGVMYPLYTFSTSDNDLKFEYVPFFIEGSSEKVLNEIKNLALLLCKKVKSLNSIQRKKLHLAAVMSSNFTNYLLDLTSQYLKKEKVGELDDLMPLIEKTVSKAKKYPPNKVQTGPAARGDLKTINEHIALLKNYPPHKEIYKLFSKSILQSHHPIKKK